MDIRTTNPTNPSPTTSQAPQPYVILGSDGFAIEVFWNILDTFANFFNTAQNYAYLPSYFIFADENAPHSLTQIDTGKGMFRLVKDWAFDRDHQFVIGITDPAAKRLAVAKALLKGLTPAATVVHPRALVQNARIGVGGIVAPGCVVTSNVTLGDYVVLHPNCTIGYGNTIDDYATLTPGTVLEGIS